VPIFLGNLPTSQPFAPGYRAPLLGGEAGTAQTIALMRQLIDQALADAEFVRLTVDIVRSVPAYDDLGEAESLYNWVKSHIRYTKDPVTKEKLYPPTELLKIRAGDCDDISMLLGAMLLALGYPARLITISANPDDPSEFSHVYVEGEIPPGSGQWVPLDAARPNSKFGEEPPIYFRKRAWSLVDDAYQDLSGTTRLRGLGNYMGDGLDWSQIVNQSIQEIPQIMAVATQQPTAIKTAAGSVATGSPYASFATPYTPGYGLTPAGYASVPVTTSLGQIWPWLLGGALLLMAFGGKH
jgi:hypothetical protein